MTKEQIKNIAQELDCGVTCYVHKLSKAVISIPTDEDHLSDFDDDAWKSERKEIKKNIKKYIEIPTMSSSEAFEVMRDFAEQVDDPILQDKLEQALEGRKPFANFKIQIDNSGDYRQRWFDFKEKRLIEYVEENLKENHLLT
jgi:hypothetical protein